MSLLLLLAITAIALAPIALLALALTAFARNGTPSAPGRAATATAGLLPHAIRTHAQRTRTIAWAVAAVTVLALILTLPALTRGVVGAFGPDGPTGLALALAPLAVAVAYCGAQLIGERTWPRPAGEVRAATLAVRTTATTSPRTLRVLTITWAIALVSVVIVCGILGDGNRYTHSYMTQQGLVTSSSGPFPGWPYGLPTLALTALLCLLAMATLITIRRRPAVPTLSDDEDVALRRRASTYLLVVVQSALGLTLAGNLAFAGFALRSSDLAVAGIAALSAAGLVALSTAVVATLALGADR
mgnify:FL=1